MHLAVDAMGAKYGGGATGLLEFLQAAISDSRVNRGTVFCTPADNRLFNLPLSDKLSAIAKPSVDKNYFLRILWYERLLARECQKIGVDVLFVAANFGQSGFGIPHVTYVRQSLPFCSEAIASWPSYYDRLKCHAYRWQMRRSCRSAARVICQSSVMKSWVTAAFDLDPSKVVTVYTAPKNLLDEAVINSDSLRERKSGDVYRLLYVGSDYPYKKLDTAVAALDVLRRELPSLELVMTLPTDHHWACLPGVKCIGYLNDSRLASAYRSADVLILPSLVESGPQTPLEAMSMGTPVLVADRPYAHDICEDAAVFFDPNRASDFAEKALTLLSDRNLCQSLIEKGLALVERRKAAEPYKKILDVLLECAGCTTCSTDTKFLDGAK